MYGSTMLKSDRSVFEKYDQITAGDLGKVRALAAGNAETTAGLGSWQIVIRLLQGIEAKLGLGQIAIRFHPGPGHS